MKNKIKTALSVLFLLAYAIIGGGSFDGEDITVFLIVIGILALIGIVVAIIQSNNQKEEAELKRQEREELRKASLREKERLCKEYETQKNAFIEQHGVPDTTIFWKDYDINAEINVYESQKRVFIMGNEYAFKDILSCSFTDNPTTVKGKLTAVSQSKADNGNTIGRAIVGGAIAGSAGAIIGGTTANRQTQTVYNQGSDKTYHDYTVIINVNSIAKPIIRINTGEDGRLTNEIVGLMNVIISRK